MTAPPSLLEASFEVFLRLETLSVVAGERVEVVGLHSVERVPDKNGEVAIMLDIHPIVDGGRDYVIARVAHSEVQHLDQQQILAAFLPPPADVARH